MRKAIFLLSAVFLLLALPGCSKRAYTQSEGLMLTNKYDRGSNKKKSKKSKKQYKKRQRALKKSNR